jgi:hypothetical protein
VTVYLDGQAIVPILTLAQAEKSAAAMFSKIGVHIRWGRGKAPIRTSGCRTAEEVAIQARIADRLQGTNRRDMLGQALPYGAGGGTRLMIGYDRQLFDAHPGLLAHVLAHEIAHVLQGIARHSETGIMKASWNKEERYEMERKPLSFTAGDGDLIRAAMARPTPAGCEELVAVR